MLVDDVSDICGYLLGRHLDGKLKTVTVLRDHWDGVSEEVWLELLEFPRRRFAPTPDQYRYCRDVGPVLRLYPSGDDIDVC
jgi:hypothetical protein